MLSRRREQRACPIRDLYGDIDFEVGEAKSAA